MIFEITIMDTNHILSTSGWLLFNRCRLEPTITAPVLRPDHPVPGKAYQVTSQSQSCRLYRVCYCGSFKRDMDRAALKGMQIYI